jgi:hypothetical protein
MWLDFSIGIATAISNRAFLVYAVVVLIAAVALFVALVF